MHGMLRIYPLIQDASHLGCMRCFASKDAHGKPLLKYKKYSHKCPDANTAYMSNPCHIELMLVEEEKQVEKAPVPAMKLSRKRLARLRPKA